MHGMGASPFGQKVYTPDTTQCYLQEGMHRRFSNFNGSIMALFVFVLW